MSDYSIKISGPDFVFEKFIDLNKVNKVIQVCMDNFQSIANDESIMDDGQIEKTLNVKPPKVERTTNECPHPMSLAEYYKKFSPKRNPDKILIFANYTIEILRREGFNPEKLKEIFSKVGEKTPKNYSRDFKWAIFNGWLDKLPNSDEYYVTNSGKDVLNGNFHPDLIKKTKQPNTRRWQKKNKQVHTPSKEE
ncbi:MAG: hypothetical protein M1412_02075 [Deltaproteobacteria bacterium]|nr:hypothetical protein [Deltaproteobacteria bacterium]MCL5891944.1 hypothetical protein [Deltaproteobacteria bacterium]